MSGGEPPPNLSFSEFRAADERDISSFVNVTPVNDRIKIWDALIRNTLAAGIMAAFLIVNGFTLGVLIWLGREDHHDLVRKLIVPADRIVNKDVIISLLGASTVQLGSIAVIMAKYVFRAQVDDPP
jgi:hypothetical protein